MARAVFADCFFEWLHHLLGCEQSIPAYTSCEGMRQFLTRLSEKKNNKKIIIIKNKKNIYEKKLKKKNCDRLLTDA